MGKALPGIILRSRNAVSARLRTVMLLQTLRAFMFWPILVDWQEEMRKHLLVIYA